MCLCGRCSVEKGYQLVGLLNLPKSSDLKHHPFRVVIQIGKACYQSTNCCEIASKMWYTCLGFRGRIAHRRLAVSPTFYAIGYEN